VGDGGFQVLGGDRLPEQGFVGVFELDDRVFYDQGQGVELLGDFVLTIIIPGSFGRSRVL
jgi:hypothetical protein